MKAPTKTVAATCVAIMLLVGACSGADDDDADGPTSTEGTVDSSETSTSTTTTEPKASRADLATDAWTEAWSLAGENTSTVETLSDVASPQAAERLIGTLHLGQEQLGDAFEGRTVTNHPTLEDNGDGTFTVNDCLLISPPVTPAESNWYSGTIEEVDGVFTVTAVEPEVATGCVPSSVAEQVYTAWGRYWDLWADGVQSGNEEFEELVTGEYADVILPNLEARPKDQVFRQFDEHHPEIIEFRPGFVRISSCSDASAETGRYDVTSGERLDVPVEEAEGEQNAYTLNLVEEEGEWKVSGRGADLNVDCQPAPTELAIPEV